MLMEPLTVQWEKEVWASPFGTIWALSCWQPAWVFMGNGKDAEELEALACKEGLSLASEWCHQQVVLTMDSSAVAGFLKTSGDHS